LASWQTTNGHICLPLNTFAGRDIHFSSEGCEKQRTGPEFPAWTESLRSCAVVGGPGEDKPLILEEGRLYLSRYWNYEKELLGFIKEYLSCASSEINLEWLRFRLEQLFPGENLGEIPPWAKIAAATALLRRFCIICGGPGTGKTTLVLKILILLLEQAGENPPRIALTAPTGKAANRLKESLQHWKTDPALNSGMVSSLPDEVFTLHRLLGSKPFSSAFRHHHENPLPYDVVIVDEGSMVDLALMVKLFRALPRDARLILLGDKNQLASVEAGAVLADLSGPLRLSPVAAKKTSVLEMVCGCRLPEAEAGEASSIQDAVVILQKSFRFNEESGIARVSHRVNRGRGREAWQLLQDDAYPDCRWQNNPPPGKLTRLLVERFKPHYAALFATQSPAEFLARFFRFMILCAVRQGPFGVEAVNSGLEKELERLGFIQKSFFGFEKRPIMITANDYRLGLYNGDIGVVFEESRSRRLYAYFPLAGGRLKRLSVSRLPAHETVLAMTVHKSQGSEFDQVLFLMPDSSSEIQTRELVYTAITRARNQVEIFGRKGVFLDAVSRRVDRSSGISSALMHLEKSPF
jgi:exodeoxyribonuclease V alpha subunit